MLVQRAPSRLFLLMLLILSLAIAFPSRPLPSVQAAIAPEPSAVPADEEDSTSPALLPTSPLIGPYAAVQSQASEPAPSLTTQIEVSSGAVEVGETVAFTVTVANQSDEPALDLAVALPIPAGTTPVGAFSTQLPPGDWSLPALAGSSSLSFTGQLRLDSPLAGEALLLEASVTSEDHVQASITRGGAVVVDAAQASGTTRFTPGQPALLESADGRVRVEIPATLSTTGLTLSTTLLEETHARLRAEGRPVPPRDRRLEARGHQRHAGRPRRAGQRGAPVRRPGDDSHDLYPRAAGSPTHRRAQSDRLLV